MKKFLPAFLFFLTSVSLFGQLNMTLLGNLGYDQNINDVWGYAAPDSTEYALVGTQTGLSIVQILADTLIEVDFESGTNSTWRDIKEWKDFAYVSTEEDDGVQVVDLRNLPDSTSSYFYLPQIPGFGSLKSIHNLFIDEFGILYVIGSNLNEGGVLMFDVDAEPGVPKFIMAAPGIYAHDAYARDSVLYASEIYRGEFAIYDFSDTSNIVLLGRQKTPFEFTHNAWLSDDSKKLFTTDERADAFVGSYDISNPTDIIELDRYRPAASLGTGTIPHNAHVWNDYLIISYYTDGGKVIDASRPDNLIEVGNFDSFLGGNGGFDGAWGAYPFLPSQKVLISDRQSGLFVVEPNYLRGAYLEGTVSGKASGNESDTTALINAAIAIISEEIITPELSKANGVFKTGKAIPGKFLVRITADGYYPWQDSVDMKNGEVKYLDVVLDPLPRYNFGGDVIDVDGKSRADVSIYLYSPAFQYEMVSDEDGKYSVDKVVQGSYIIYAGLWGQYLLDTIEINSESPQTLQLVHGYYDDFTLDFKWLVSGDAESGQWVRAEPSLTKLFNFYDCNPGADVVEDLGTFAYVTGNAEGVSAEQLDVDGGSTILSTPPMDLSSYHEPILSFRPWICKRFNSLSTYKIFLTEGVDTIEIGNIETGAITGFWIENVSFDLTELIKEGSDVQVHFVVEEVRNNQNDDDIIEAGMDAFLIIDANPTSTSVSDIDHKSIFKVYPNPFESSFTIDLLESETHIDEVRMINQVGQTVTRKSIAPNQNKTQVTLNSADGIYFVQLLYQGRLIATRKVFKLR